MGKEKNVKREDKEKNVKNGDAKETHVKKRIKSKIQEGEMAKWNM